ncbi:succinate dehydrogenase assembly factor, mitochondrial [Raphidocelis subcapitata]|uniref:Succinate dehydrogenase assembly factor 3 n=1 Tax=Raphidocelis subcapitata TaxID=307507 RepID=A0A2V0NQZ2_9CHLO|nr:succinate dehydrogenase assembly factor, mitochondrial [Raphidocelis subcapitata]|eukprot:GBF90061.1 succinate dehydrogenase assembly factor, mitochondrial [Raphidocelis subcapitata]
MPAAAAEPGLARLLSLYRQVLRMHRRQLPTPLRSLGDSYVQSEFRRHLKGKTSEAQWREFGDQWGAYLSMLAGRADADEEAGDARPLHDAERAMTPEQRAQMQQLREAALQLGGEAAAGGSGGGGGGGGGAQP